MLAPRCDSGPHPLVISALLAPKANGADACMISVPWRTGRSLDHAFAASGFSGAGAKETKDETADCERPTQLERVGRPTSSSACAGMAIQTHPSLTGTAGGRGHPAGFDPNLRLMLSTRDGEF